VTDDAHAEGIVPRNGGWTLLAVLAHLERVIQDQDKRWSQLTEAQATAIQAALVSQEKAVAAALAAADKAVLKAEISSKEWQAASNEWRGAMSDRERTFIPRTEHEQAIRTLNEKLDLLEKWNTRSEGRSGGMGALWGYLVGAVGVALAVYSQVGPR
jgi:hypothetical protein